MTTAPTPTVFLDWGSDAPSLITSGAQLRAYLDGHPGRHIDHGDGTCSCGYPGVPPQLVDHMRAHMNYPTPTEHAEAVVIGDLGNLIPSDHFQPDENGIQQPVPYRVLVQQLTTALDERDRNLDPRLVVLMRWALDNTHADVQELARITTMNACYLGKTLGIPMSCTDEDPAAPLPDSPDPEREAHPDHADPHPEPKTNTL